MERSVPAGEEVYTEENLDRLEDSDTVIGAGDDDLLLLAVNEYGNKFEYNEADKTSAFETLRNKTHLSGEEMTVGEVRDALEDEELVIESPEAGVAEVANGLTASHGVLDVKYEEE